MHATAMPGLVSTLDIRFTVEEPEHVEAVMPITEVILQPHGYVHGGATLSLLESVASRGAELMCDLTTSVPFGVHMDVRHKKPGTSGSVRGVATLDHVDGNKQFWNVRAYDDDGDVMSEGVFMTKIVTLQRLEEKRAARQADGTNR